jgi:hypothetical protein
MSMLGRFLEFSTHTPDILESLGFYKRLGFTEQQIGDIWSHKYAVVSDGNICIGLHDRVFDSPALTFIHEDVAHCARSMSDHGFDLSYLQLDDDVFNLLGFSDSDGHTVSMLEARTFMSPDEDTPDSVCGSCFEVSLPVRDALQAGRFWAPLAPTILNLREEPTTHMRFDAARMPLGLSESIALKRPSLCFKCDDKTTLAEVIEMHGLKSKPFPGFEGAFVELQAPEGTSLFVFSEDFLGESYVVDESNEAPGADDSRS